MKQLNICRSWCWGLVVEGSQFGAVVRSHRVKNMSILCQFQGARGLVYKAMHDETVRSVVGRAMCGLAGSISWMPTETIAWWHLSIPSPEQTILAHLFRLQTIKVKIE